MSEPGVPEITHKNIAKTTHEMMESRAIRDGLTGAFNRRYLEEKLDKMMQLGDSFGIIMFDLDRFKKVNDTYGHRAGDAVLKEFKRILDENIRIGNGDAIARYGGEEFVVVIPKINEENLQERAENIRKAVEVYNFRIPNGPEKSTVSGGFGIWDGKENKDKLINRIDAALYVAKTAQGRNAVVKSYPNNV